MDTSQTINKVSEFKHSDIVAIRPDFDSKLMDLIIELEKLREKRIRTKIPADVFFQLKNIFHILESVDNNRFEGNPTTLAEYIETKIQVMDKQVLNDEKYKAIDNTSKAMIYIEDHLKKGDIITSMFIRDIHRIVVDGLTPLPKGEGSNHPGGYKTKPNQVGIHIAPDPTYIEVYMQELEKFINEDISKKYELIRTAIAHHRFVWIHPFDNGNGRVVRLLTYAMLIRQGIINTDIKMFQIINPTGIFGNKQKYSELLAGCDEGDTKHIEERCEYVLEGLLKEINKIDKILDIEYTKSKIILPAIKYAYERHYINELEYNILNVLTEEMEIKLDNIRHLFPENTMNSKITYNIQKLKKRGILVPTSPNARTYSIGFMRNELLRCIIQRLREEGFIDFDA